MNFGCQPSNSDMLYPSEPLKPKKKNFNRKITGDTHQCLTELMADFCRFIITWPYMSISHIVNFPFPCDGQNAPEDATVSLQYCKEYIYVERCANDKIIAAVDNIKEETTKIY